MGAQTSHAHGCGDPEANRARLRVGVVLEEAKPAAWIARIIHEIQASREAGIAVVIRRRRRKAREVRPPLVARILRALYAAVDAGTSRIVNDPLAPRCVSQPLRHVPVVWLDEVSEGEWAALERQRLDVLLNLGSQPLPDRALGIAPSGVWSYVHGDDFWEVMSQAPTVSAVQARRREGGTRILYQSYAPTDPFSVRRNRKNCYWKSSAFAMRALRDLYDAAGPPPPSVDEAPPSRQALSGAAVAAALVRRTQAVLRDRLRGLLTRQQWVLAYAFDRSGLGWVPAHSFAEFQQLVPPRDRLWADPFVAKHGDGWVLLFEERTYGCRNGHIAGVEIDAEGRVGEVFPVLRRDYHLSYPFIFPWNGTWWMVPESARNRTIELWRATDFPRHWSLERTLMAGIRAVDATMLEHAGRWWMFCNISERGASRDDELHLFQATSPLGPWRPHRRNPVKSDIRGARPAGRPFVSNGVLFRPGQDGSRGYGGGIVMHRVDRIDPQGYAEVAVAWLWPDWRPGLSGLHTINAADGLTAIDLRLSRGRLPIWDRV